MVDANITDVAVQQKWMWARIRISPTWYMRKKRDGGLRKLREELEAENSGVQIPTKIRWVGGAKVRARFQEKKEGASSVVAAVLKEARGWQSPPPKRREEGTAKVPEEPEARATAVQGEEMGEVEANVLEEEGVAQAAMEMEE